MFYLFYALPRSRCIARSPYQSYGLNMNVFFLTLSVFAFATIAMASGVILSRGRKQLKGSCGGPSLNPNCCMTCPDKDICDDEEARQIAENDLTQIQNITHAKSGQPVGSPTQMN